MPRFWKEPLDAKRHRDHIGTSSPGGNAVALPADNIVERWAYFVDVCTFTFQFVSLAQIEECLATFERKLQPSSMEPNVTREHYWQRWEQRLPQWLFEEPKRLRVVRALHRALTAFAR